MNFKHWIARIRLNRRIRKWQRLHKDEKNCRQKQRRMDHELGLAGGRG